MSLRFPHMSFQTRAQGRQHLRSFTTKTDQHLQHCFIPLAVTVGMDEGILHTRYVGYLVGSIERVRALHRGLLSTSYFKHVNHWGERGKG